MRYHEFITEAKRVYDVRHPESDLEHFGAKKYNYIDPNDGFFVYTDGELALFSEQNMFYSERVVGTNDLSHIWNLLGGLVRFSDKTITISKEHFGEGLQMRQRDIPNIQEFQKSIAGTSTLWCDG